MGTTDILFVPVKASPFGFKQFPLYTGFVFRPQITLKTGYIILESWIKIQTFSPQEGERNSVVISMFISWL